MIHAGVISTGSAYTSGVCGEYCSSSIRRLRNTTLPGVMATSLPTSNRSVPGVRSAAAEALRILEPVLQAADQVLPGLRGSLVEELRVGVQEIGRRGRFQQQPPGEAGACQLRVRRGRLQRLLPPGGPVGISARVDVEGPYIPGGVAEALRLAFRRERAAARGLRGKLPAYRGVFRRRSAPAVPGGAAGWRRSGTTATRPRGSHRAPARR